MFFHSYRGGCLIQFSLTLKITWPSRKSYVYSESKDTRIMWPLINIMSVFLSLNLKKCHTFLHVFIGTCGCFYQLGIVIVLHLFTQMFLFIYYRKQIILKCQRSQLFTLSSEAVVHGEFELHLIWKTLNMSVFIWEFLAINPMGKVPVLVHNGNKLSQSPAILEYLDEVYPNYTLPPNGNPEKAVKFET